MTRGVKTPNIHIIREEYITTPNHITVEQLSVKHEVPYQTLKERCMNEKWVEQREEFQQKAAQESYAKQLKQEVKRRAELLEKGKLIQEKIIDSLLRQEDYCPSCGDKLPFVRSLDAHALDKVSRLLGFTAGDVDSRPAGGMTEKEAQKWADDIRQKAQKQRENANQSVKK